MALWQRYTARNHFTPEQEHIIAQDYFFERDGKTPRYYQTVAIQRAAKAKKALVDHYTGKARQVLAALYDETYPEAALTNINELKQTILQLCDNLAAQIRHSQTTRTALRDAILR